MSKTIFSDTKKSSKKLAQQVAKQMAQEPLEILKQAGKQATGVEKAPSNQNQPDLEKEKGKMAEERELKVKLEAQSKRQIQVLENELKKIQQEKDVKKQQEEIMQEQAEEVKKEEKKIKPLIEPASKRPRNIFAFFGLRKSKKKGGQLTAERQKHRVERPMPPTG